jgi:hypothetical protein
MSVTIDVIVGLHALVRLLKILDLIELDSGLFPTARSLNLLCQ